MKKNSNLYKWKVLGLWLVPAVLLAGCGSMTSLGPMGSTISHQQIKSVDIKSAIKDRPGGYSGCPIESGQPYNRCDAWRNVVYLGPISVIGHNIATQQPLSPRVVHYTRYSGGSGILGLAGVLMPVNSVGDLLGSMALINSSPDLGNVKAWGNSKNAFVDQKKLYNATLKELNSGKAIWVMRYYVLPKGIESVWAADVNASVHHLVALSVNQSSRPLGWASLSIHDKTYRPISDKWFGDSGVFGYQFSGDAPKTMPDIYPIDYYWLDQAWKNPNKAVIVVPGPDKSHPFTAIAAMKYRIKAGFNVPQWIHAHQSALSDGWIVVYHQNHQTLAWKDGQTTAYRVSSLEIK